MKTGRLCLCSGFLSLALTIFSQSSFGQIKAQFTSDVQSGCAPLIVNFQDATSGNPTGWKWSLGNGTISTLQNPTGTYFDAGTYAIELIAKNAAGTDSIVKTSFVTVYANPQVNFTASPLQGCYPLNVKFSDESKAGSGTITEKVWDFGDGNVITDDTKQHIYTLPGVFGVTLKVTNSYGCYNVLTQNNYIHIDNGVNADFSITSLDICKTPAVVNFKNSSNGSGAITYLWNFGDGSTDKTNVPSHKYISPGTYNIVLTAQSSGGCSDTASQQVTIAFPTSTIKNTDATCSNQSISFTNASVPAPISTKWYFGDGSSSTDLNPVKTYTKTGSYKVKLVNIFSTGCSDSTTKNITIVAGPSPSFMATDTTKCAAPLNVHFTNTTKGNAVKYIWDFGDGTSSTDLNADHTYTQAGAFTVTLTAINSNGCQSTFQKANYINIIPVKISQVHNLPDSGCIPLVVKPSVSFNVSTTIKKYTWDFGDGTIAFGANPSHTYIKEGIYNVKVSIETEDGCTDVLIINRAVLAGHKPKAGFINSFDTVCPKFKVKFSSTSSNGPITFLRWNYGTFQDSVAGHYYDFEPLDTGSRGMTLVAYNYGCADTFTMQHALYALPPYAKISLQLNCNNKTLVNFGDSSEGDLKRTWDFGDGKTDNTKNPVHNYALPGVYNVTLYTSTNTCRDTAYSTVHVINEKGQMLLPGSVFCRGNNMIADISGINVQNVKTTNWDFGDGTIVTVNGATKSTHAYVIAGKFIVTATMTDLNNCQYTYATKDSITVFGPLADFTSLKPGICQDGTVLFKDRSESDGLHSIIKWSWNYGDNVIKDYSSSTVFSKTYNDTGYYNAVLTVKDSYGCSDSLRRPNYVYVSHPYASFIKSDSILCPGSQVSLRNTSIGTGLQYNWYFGDGSKTGARNPSYSYSKPGIYTPALSIVDVNGCKDSIVSKPLIVSAPSAKFNMSDSISSCPPLQVDFTNKSTNYNSFGWNFGDGGISDVASPTHIYTYPGVYTVELNLKGFGSCNDNHTRKIIIKGPTGKLSYDSLPKCYPATVNFSATTSHTKKYTWDFSDGNAVTMIQNQTVHTYDTGFYVPKLILTDSSGCKVAIQGKDTVKVYNVTARAIVTNDKGCDSATVTFKDASSSLDKIIHHIWYFGDSLSADAISGNHLYNKSGNYKATLVAITKLGCRDTLHIAKPIFVSPSPVISVEGDLAACASAQINLKGKTSFSDSLQWHWKLENGSQTGKSISTSFSKGGTYLVSVVASGITGCSNSITQKIKINDAPKVYAGSDTSTCLKSVFQLNAHGAVNYSWEGAALSCNTCQSPNIIVDSVATYKVTGTDEIGCKGIDSVTIKAIMPIAVRVSGNDTLCAGEKTQLLVSGAKRYQWSPAVYLDDAKSAQPFFTAVRDTSIRYKVIGYTENNCFADTGYVTVKAFPVPKMNIQSDEILLNVGSSVRLLAKSSPDVNHWQWQPVMGLDNAVAEEPLASPKQTTTYSVIASNGGGCVARDEITVRVICKNTSVFIPNTFSPNNDGMNETFYPRGTGLFNVKSFRIFNRWGQLVFERYNVAPNNSSDGWNGKFNDKALTSDVYVYMMEVVCENGFIIPVKGNVTLLR